MIDGQKILGLITARGGSKEVPAKNVRVVGGKPLIAWTIEAGKASKYLDRLILSSDDDVIIEVANHYGCEVPFKRAAWLAEDETPCIDVVLDALDRCPGYDWVVLLQPTSPLRTAEDIDSALKKCIELSAPACVSVCEADQSPYWMYTLENSRLRPIIDKLMIKRRQDLPRVYVLNGAVYAAQSEWLRSTRSFMTAETVVHTMPPNRSQDLDSERDFEAVEMYFKKKGRFFKWKKEM